MKITGKKSLSKYLSYLMYFGFIIFLAHLIYILTGISICYLNFINDVSIFPNTFVVEKISYHEDYVANMFIIKFPFTDQNFFNGELKWMTIIGITLGFSYLTYFFYSAYNIFKNLSMEVIFTKETINWLQRFAYTNIIFFILFISLWYFVWHLVNLIELVSYSIILILLSVVFLYISAFFKKGYELQSESDLTI